VQPFKVIAAVSEQLKYFQHFIDLGGSYIT